MWYVDITLQLAFELTSSVALFVLCILLQIFAMDGYTTRKFQIVLYAWVSSLRISMKIQAEVKVVILLILETLVSSLIVTAILKGSNTGFRKTDKLMKRIAMYV